MTCYLLEPAAIGRMMEIERASFPSPWSEKDVLAGFRMAGALRYLGLYEKPDGELQGWSCVWTGSEEAHLMTLAIHPQARGKGLGRELLRASITAAADAGCRYMELECRSGNMAAQQLYKSEGFLRVGTRKGYYEDTGEDAWIYVLPALPAGHPENDPYLITEEDGLDL